MSGFGSGDTDGNGINHGNLQNGYDQNNYGNTDHKVYASFTGQDHVFTGYEDIDDPSDGAQHTTPSGSPSYGTAGNEGRTESIQGQLSADFYSESYKKGKVKKGIGLGQLLGIGLLCSIAGSVITLMLVAFFTPSGWTGSLSSGLKGAFSKANVAEMADNGIYKKIEIQQTDSPVSAIAEKVSPSIVGIRITASTKNIFGLTQTEGSEGSGIIIKSDGYILTNYHVIESANSNSAKIEVFLPNQKDKGFEATIVGSDWRTDLAVLKINGSNLPAAELGNSDDLKVGEIVVAIGNPAGFELMGSVTVGYVSGLNRNIPIEGLKDLKLIQTDAAINPGNSGGALVNSRGQVIGINNSKMGGEGFEGLGFAIPINKAKEVTDSLMEFKYVKGRPLLGITPDTRFTESVAKQYKVPPGVLVADVHPLSGAYKAGIQAGDIITKIDGKEVKNRTELDEIKNKFKPGETVPLQIYRDGKTLNVQVMLIEDTGN